MNDGIITNYVYLMANIRFFFESYNFFLIFFQIRGMPLVCPIFFSERIGVKQSTLRTYTGYVPTLSYFSVRLFVFSFFCFFFDEMVGTFLLFLYICIK